MQQENKILISAILIILLGVVAFNFNSNLSGAVSKTGDVMVTVKDNCAKTGSMMLNIEAPEGSWEEGYVNVDGKRITRFNLRRGTMATVTDSRLCTYQNMKAQVTIRDTNRNRELSKTFIL